MKQNSKKTLQKISLLIFLFTAVAYTATAQYTLTDDDVVVTDSVIVSCSYDFSVKDIIIPETLDGQSVIGIAGPGIFEYCGITDIELPATLTFIGDLAFSYNNALTHLDLSACTALTSIGDWAFYSNSLTGITLPGSITHIGRAAFNTNEISTVNGISSDGIIYARNADTSTDSTTIVSYGGVSDSVTIPGQVVTVGDWAFYNNSLTGIILPGSITHIGKAAFNTNEISSVNGISSDGIIYARNADTSTDSSTIVSYGGVSDSVTIPPQVVTIGEFAFTLNNLTGLNLSACTALTSIDYCAFESNNLPSIDLSTCTALTSIGGLAFLFNDFFEFTLPTPNITGYQFDYWLDGNNNEHHEGGDLVIDLGAIYTAILSKMYRATFTITDGTNAIANATVCLTGYGTATSNVSGVATFSGIVAENDIVYTISAVTYDDANGTISVVDTDANEPVTLSLTTTDMKEFISKEIDAYPNPVSSVLTITQSAGNAITNIELYTIKGQKIKADAIVKNKNTIKLNMEGLEQGIYILKISTRNNGSYSKTILKE